MNRCCECGVQMSYLSDDSDELCFDCFEELPDNEQDQYWIDLADQVIENLRQHLLKQEHQPMTREEWDETYGEDDEEE